MKLNEFCVGKDAQDCILGYSQPSPSTSSGQALRDLVLDRQVLALTVKAVLFKRRISTAKAKPVQPPLYGLMLAAAR